MIGSISIWLKSIIGVVILASFMELLLPSGKMKQYVAFAVGLITLLVIAKPWLSATELPLFPSADIGQREYRVEPDQVAFAVEQQLKTLLKVDWAKVQLNDNLEIVAVYVNSREHIQAVADFLGLRSDQVHLREDTNGKLAN